ncbi:MAG: hypothetical protein LC749_22260, partial [Actinobacteria bacterium]|nr:hypothetical protein [Actinomycetota bacterium]
MITREWLGAYARSSQGEDLGQIYAIYVDDQTDQPEFAAVRLADTGTWLVPLARATAQDEMVQLAYAWDQVQAVPVVAAGDRISR